MSNAKNELLEILKDNPATILAAIVGFADGFYPTEAVILRENYTKDQYDNFLNYLDRDYDGGFGSQNLFGQILTDKYILYRHEYDGSESWELIIGMKAHEYTADNVRELGIHGYYDDDILAKLI